MLAIPEVDGIDAAFGSIKHMPEFSELPEEFQKTRGPYCDAASMWFFKGGKRDGRTLHIDGIELTAKQDVDVSKALRAVKAVLGSFAPKHEHKIAACGFMLSEWFDLKVNEDAR